MHMSTPYELSGRTRQKQRTRIALVTAARELVARGETPTVDEAAASASVSRTTAYRYFPNQRSLLVAAHPEIEAHSLLPEKPPTDVAARLDAVVAAFLHIIVDTEAQQRTMLRLSLDPDPSHPREPPPRTGPAIRWIGEALSPLRGQMAERDMRRLILAIRSAAGIESLVWLTDIAGLSRKEAVGLMRWSTGALLRSALAESRGKGHQIGRARRVGVSSRRGGSHRGRQ